MNTGCRDENLRYVILTEYLERKFGRKWKQLFESYYLSDDGRIFSLFGENFLTLIKVNYYNVINVANRFSCIPHIQVAILFLDNPDKLPIENGQQGH